MAATLISWRTAVCASSTRRGVAYYGGIALALFAIFALIDWGWWAVALLAAAAAALALWLACLWNMPGTLDGYRARVARLIGRMNESATWTYSPIAHAGRLSHELKRVTPPPRWRAQHDGLVELAGPAGAARDAELPFRERVRRAAARRRGFDTMLERFARDQSTPDEQRYVASMNALIAQSRTYGRARLEALGDELDRTLARLGRVRPPAAAANEHAALVDALTEYVAATKALYAQWSAQPPGEKAEALDAVEQARTRVEAALEPYRSTAG